MARGPGEDSSPMSIRSKKANGKGRWSLEEHGRFLEGVRLYGKNWDAIRALVPSRTAMQIRTHYSPKYAARKHKGPALQDEALKANTVRGELPTESQGRVPKQPSASELQAKLRAANVRKVDFLEPSVFVQAQPPHVQGTYAGMNSVARTQHLGSTNNGDKWWLVAPRSGAINAGPAPEEAYGRLTSRPHLPAPVLTPTFNEAASRRYGPEIPTAAIQTAPSVYGDRPSAHDYHHVGHGNASAHYNYGMSRSRFQVADEGSSGVCTSRCRRVGLSSQACGVCKPACVSRMAADTDEAGGILDCFYGADIFGVL